MQIEVDTLSIELTTISSDKRPVFITGNFCKWLPDLEEFRMTMISPGEYKYQFPDNLDLPNPLEYKYTRGGWDQVELDQFGKPYGNRLITKREGVVQDNVTRWQKDMTKKIDYSPIIEVLAESFEIPQLNRSRRIHVLLPYDYHDRPDQRYPVHYMTDAQNLFGEGSEYGNWKIDKSLTKLTREGNANAIIIAIEHGGEDRIQELSPYDNPKLGKGLGASFLRFITDTLKPHVDAKYRTKPDRLNTGIGGSSVGGLLTVYAGLMSPHIFGRLMIFSPSLWISQRVYFDAIHFFEPFESRIYLYAGGQEGANMISNFKRFHATLENQRFGYDRVKIQTSIDPKGEHSENQWSKEFPVAFKWLYGE
jgi:predicted alpha/beta superfamily hydrolase